MLILFSLKSVEEKEKEPGETEYSGQHNVTL